MVCECNICEARGEIVESTDMVCLPCFRELRDKYDRQNWVPVSERLPERAKDRRSSDWVVVTDGKEWTIAVYDHKYQAWRKDHSPYDLCMGPVTHWKPISLPEPEPKVEQKKPAPAASGVENNQ